MTTQEKALTNHFSTVAKKTVCMCEVSTQRKLYQPINMYAQAEIDTKLCLFGTKYGAGYQVSWFQKRGWTNGSNGHQP